MIDIVIRAIVIVLALLGASIVLGVIVGACLSVGSHADDWRDS